MTNHVRIKSVLDPKTGERLIQVARGLYGTVEGIHLSIKPEQLAGVLDKGEDGRKEIAWMVNTIGLLVLSRLVGHNLGQGPDGLPRKIAEWGGIDVAALTKEADEELAQEALRIAQAKLKEMDDAERAEAGTPAGDGAVRLDGGRDGPPSEGVSSGGPGDGASQAMAGDELGA